MDKIQRNKPVQQVKQFVGSVARTYQNDPAKVLNRNQSTERINSFSKQADRNMPPKRKIAFGPGRLPVSRSLPSYPR